MLSFSNPLLTLLNVFKNADGNQEADDVTGLLRLIHQLRFYVLLISPILFFWGSTNVFLNKYQFGFNIIVSFNSGHFSTCVA